MPSMAQRPGFPPATLLNFAAIQYRYPAKADARARGITEYSGLEIIPSFWFNSDYNYRLSLVPGILGFLITLIAGYLTALNIVQEKKSAPLYRQTS